MARSVGEIEMIIINIIIICATCVFIVSKVLNTIFELVHAYFDTLDGSTEMQKRLDKQQAQLDGLEDRHAELSSSVRKAMGWK